MKVLVISERYWPEGGGAELATHLIVKILVRNRLKPVVVTSTRQPNVVEGAEYFITPYLASRNKVELWLKIFTLNSIPSFKKMLMYTDIVYIPHYCYPVISLAKKLKKKVVVHLHDYQPISYNAIVPFPYEKYHNLSLIECIKESLKFEIMEHKSLLRAVATIFLRPINSLCKYWLKDADELICVSKRQAEIIHKNLQRRPKVVYNPLPEVPQISTNFDSSSFLYVGGMSYIKGVHIFIQASKKLVARVNEVKFLIAGKCNGIEKMLPRTIINNHYRILGKLKHEEMLKRYSQVSALIFPSLCEEPFPYAVIEAMLAGAIPIASRVGGVPEIVQGTNAEQMLFEPGNVQELIDRMNNVLSLRKEVLNNLRINLRENILKKINENKIEKQLLDIFNN